MTMLTKRLAGSCLPRWMRCRPAAWLLALVLLVCTSRAAWLCFTGNLHAVLAGRLYRSAQLGPVTLEHTLRKYGIQTVINLRGQDADAGWYRDETAVCQALGVVHDDVPLTTNRLPWPTEVTALIHVLDRCRYPVLIHCAMGADRAGLASAIALLASGQAELPAARAQLSLLYGHVPFGVTRHADAFLAQYAAWLDACHRRHNAALFRAWVRDVYCPGEYRCRLEWLDRPTCVLPNQAALAHFRAWNISLKPWRFRAGTTAGVHAYCAVQEIGGTYHFDGRTGLFDRDVAPGTSLDLAVVLPPLPRAGRYSVFVTLVDEQGTWFAWTDSQCLCWVCDVFGP